MGRHSAPDTDDDDGAVAVVSSQVRIGRHWREDDSPPELPTEQTTLIPVVEADAAADADAAGGDLTGVRAAELEPILPGEAVVPPPAGELDALDQLLVPSQQPRSWGRRPKPAKVEAAAVTEPPVAEPPVVEAPVVEAPVVEAPVVEPPVVEARSGVVDRRGTQADLALLRADPALRARCLAAVLVPFAAYVIVMLVVGGHGVQWLLWVWIPTITAGVLFGVVLDGAHRTRDAHESGSA